jgi:hypothetical protein
MWARLVTTTCMDAGVARPLNQKWEELGTLIIRRCMSPLQQPSRVLAPLVDDLYSAGIRQMAVVLPASYHPWLLQGHIVILEGLPDMPALYKEGLQMIICPWHWPRMRTTT